MIQRQIQFLKECEFRFNYGSQKQQLNTLKNWGFL
jgi:transposase-like protein